MKENTGSATLRIVSGHLLQAAVCGDTAAAEGHMKVYLAILKAAEQKGTCTFLIYHVK